MSQSADRSQDKLLDAQVIAAFGRQYLVNLADNTKMTCLTRGKRSEVVCGDTVKIKRTEQPLHKTSTSSAELAPSAQGVIEHIAPRSSLLHRSDSFRSKIIAANITQIIVVVATEPSFSDELLARCLVAAFDQNLEVMIVLNKCDLADSVATARKQLAPYSSIGYRVLEISAKNTSNSSNTGTEVAGVSSLRPFLINHSSVLVGQSGMGKSTVINALLPDAQAATREISSALNSGKHTTTHARLYQLDKNSNLIDCPGVQAFGLHHLSFGRIEQGFVEFAQYLGQCRFHDCHHLHEPGCALRNAVETGKIDARRLALFQQITTSQY